jgi:hypothetical protein
MGLDATTLSLIAFGACVAALCAFLLRRGARADRRLRPRRIVLEVPPAAETRKSIQRFHEAVLRMELVEFAWRRFGPEGLRDDRK